MRAQIELRCHPDTLSSTVVRNILSKVRSFPDRNSDYVQDFDLRHGRYDVTAFCRWSRCTALVVRLPHRDSCEVWIIKPGEYSLLPAEAFDM